MRTVPVMTLLAAAICGASAFAQQPTLREAVESYLATTEDAFAAAALPSLLQRADATAPALLEVLTKPPAMTPGEVRFSVPHFGQQLVATMRIPEGHKPDAKPLPVLFDVSRGTTSLWLKLDGIILVYVAGFTPPQFSDEGRDAFLKVARTAAFLGNGDRLWLSGYSWAAHASYDTALHRPGFLRGLAPTGGGPRRVHFRLLRNLASTRVLAYCGEQDDRELVWNLRELELLRKGNGLDYTLHLDPTQAHNAPVAGYTDVPAAIRAAERGARPTRGVLYADGPEVESPLLRCVRVEAKRVAVPRQIPVLASDSLDQQRRKTIRAMQKAVATVGWKIERQGTSTKVTVEPRGVPLLHVLLRRSDVSLPGTLEVKRGSTRVFRGAVAIDRAVLLREARRTRERRDPVIQMVEVRS